MRNVLYLLTTTLILGCSSDNTPINLTEPEPEKNTVNLLVNGNEISANIVNSSAFYCDNHLNLSFQSEKNNVTSELITVVLTKDGQIKSTHFIDKSSNFNQRYRTADFVPSSTLNIEDFEFEEDKHLKFKINGTLLKETDNYLSIPEELQISAEIEINEFGKSNCETYNDFIKLNDTIYFDDISKISQNNVTNPTITYTSNSLNGFNITFKNFNTSFVDMPIGSYSFNSNSTEEKIQFRTYIGPPKAFASHIYISDNWRLYNSSGSFSIEESALVNGRTVIKGKINFSATYNGTIEYTFKNAEFEMVY